MLLLSRVSAHTAACHVWWLQALERANFDPFDPSLSKGGISPLWHVLQVKWHLVANTY